MKTKFIYAVILIFCFLPARQSIAQDNISEITMLKEEIKSQRSATEQLKQQLNNQTSALKQKLGSYASSAIVVFLFGAFCALWAQNTNRNPWIWFFAGVLFSVIAVLFVLYDNHRDISHSRK